MFRHNPSTTTLSFLLMIALIGTSFLPATTTVAANGEDASSEVVPDMDGSEAEEGDEVDQPPYAEANAESEVESEVPETAPVDTDTYVHEGATDDEASSTHSGSAHTSAPAATSTVEISLPGGETAAATGTGSTSLSSIASSTVGTTSDTGPATTNNETGETSSTSTVATATVTQNVASTSGTTTEYANDGGSSNSNGTVSENPADSELSLTHETKGTTTIATGAGVATVNLVNLINNSLVNSQGAIVLLDLLTGTTETLDLRTALASGQVQCSLTTCDLQGAIVSLEADATIDNTVLVSAHTGGNEIEDAEFAAIATGPAFANANIVNVANVNLVNARYLVVIINAFADVSGDIVLPSLFDLTTSQSTPAIHTGSSTAIIENNLNIDAQTGDNVLANTERGIVATGDASTGTTLFNLLNSTLLGGQSASLMLRVHGQWNGTVYGLPEGAELLPTSGGYLLQFSPLTTGAIAEGLATHATSSAQIRNDITVSAHTGNNRIDNADTALIHTGDAHASVNLVNFANAHVVGRNWLLGIINIYGDFTGDISFGRPDLWVGAEVTLPTKPQNGDTVTYSYTVINTGDAVASDVTITHAPSPYLTPATAAPSQWDVGTLNPGQSKSVSFEATIQNAGHNEKISTRVFATLYETDHDETNNEEIVSFYTSSGQSQSTRTSTRSAGASGATPAREEVNATATTEVLLVERKPHTTVLHGAERLVSQTITITNPTDRVVPGVSFTDTLVHPQGTEVLSELWDIGDILPQEEITIFYEFVLDDAAPAGTYRFTSRLRNATGVLYEYTNGSVLIAPTSTDPLPVLSTTLEKTDSLPPIAIPQPEAATATVAGTATTLQRFPGVRVAEAASAEVPLAPEPMTWLMLLLLLLFVIGGYARYYKKRHG